MLKQKKLIIKTQGGSLSYSDMGDVVYSGESNVSFDTPIPCSGLWYRISNTGTGTVTLNYGSGITAIGKEEQCFLIADNSSWYMSKGGAGGSPLLDWQGEWESGFVYSRYDGVSHNGSSYICLLDHSTDHEPPNDTYWGLVASIGGNWTPPKGSGVITNYGWIDNAGSIYPKKLELPCLGVTSDSFLFISIDKEKQSIATNCGLCDNVGVSADTVVFYAMTVPVDVIDFTYGRL